MSERVTEKVVTERVDRWSYIDHGADEVVVAELVSRVGEGTKPEHVKLNGKWYPVASLVALGKWLGTVAVLVLALAAPARADWADDMFVLPMNPSARTHVGSYVVLDGEEDRGKFFVLFDCKELSCAGRIAGAPAPIVSLELKSGERGEGVLTKSSFMNALGARWDGWYVSFSFAVPATDTPLQFVATFEDGSTAGYVMTRGAVKKVLKADREAEKARAQAAKDRAKRAQELLK